jgi:hypothetical protein
MPLLVVGEVVDCKTEDSDRRLYCRDDKVEKRARLRGEIITRRMQHVLRQEWTGTRYIEDAGPEQYSPNDIARALSSALGRTIEAVAVPRKKWTEFLVGQGMPEGRTEPRAEMVDVFNSGWIHFGVPGTEHITGTTSLTSVIAKLVANGSQQA